MKLSHIVILSLSFWFVFSLYALGKEHELRMEESGKHSVTLSVVTDPETQCQYVTIPSGGLTARLGTDGFPLCANQIPVEDKP
jgi:hypothetical protein